MINKTIVGAMLVSQNAELLDISIPNMLKWCDWCLILMDNESDEVRKKVYEYAQSNYDKIWIRRSSVPNDIMTRNGSVLDYHSRWKAVKGIVRNDVFLNLKSILALGQKGFDKIDILLWPDSDVIFTDHLPQLLKEFIDSDKRAITMKHIDVINDLRHIQSGNIGHHVHIMKYSPELAGLPRRFFALYHPLSASDLMHTKYYSVHLAYLTEGVRDWRNNNWKTNEIDSGKSCELPIDVTELSPEEINNIIK